MKPEVVLRKIAKYRTLMALELVPAHTDKTTNDSQSLVAYISYKGKTTAISPSPLLTTVSDDGKRSPKDCDVTVRPGPHRYITCREGDDGGHDGRRGREELDLDSGRARVIEAKDGGRKNAQSGVRARQRVSRGNNDE